MHNPILTYQNRRHPSLTGATITIRHKFIDEPGTLITGSLNLTSLSVETGLPLLECIRAMRLLDGKDPQ